MEYIRSHWRGEQALLWSFWVNLVSLRLIILFCEQFTHPPYTGQTTAAIVVTVIYFVVFQLLVCIWQIRGMIKACDRDISKLGSFSTMLLVQFVSVACIFVTLFFVMGAFQSLFEDPEAMYKNRFKKGPVQLSEYSLGLSVDGALIHMSGDFNIGLTKELKLLLEKKPDVDGIVLNSAGGRVTEGRGVAKVIKKYGLNTYVFDACMSACMTAFIGGVTRIVGAQGKLGFHQFTLDTMQKTPYIDPEVEQKIDLTFYTAQKIDKKFLEKVFQSSHTDIWFPGMEELLAAGVVHKIQEEY